MFSLEAFVKYLTLWNGDQGSTCQHLMPVKRNWQEQTSPFTLPCSRFHWSDSCKGAPDRAAPASASVTQDPRLSQMVIHPIPHQTYTFWLFCVLGWPGGSLLVSLLSLSFSPSCSLVNGILPERVPQGLPPTQSLDLLTAEEREARCLLSPLLSQKHIQPLHNLHFGH